MALVYANRAFELSPDVYSSLFLASSRRYAGDLDQALACYRSLWPAHPQRRFVVTGVAAVLADQGRVTEAWDLLEPHLEPFEDAHSLALASRLRRLLGDLAGAERYLGRATAKFGHANHDEDVKREVRELIRQATEAGDRAVAAAAQALGAR